MKIRSFWEGPPGESEPCDALKMKRKDIGVVVKVFNRLKNADNSILEKCPPPLQSIEDSNIPGLFQPVLKHFNITVLTTVQKQCWPAILCGANIIAIAPTGSGKTLGFTSPLIPHVLSRKIEPVTRILHPTALILEPTRELAIQVASVVKALRKHCSINSAVIFGGQDKEDQMDALRLANKGELHVLVATPGRLIDHLESKSISLSRVTYLVIDEADRMLSLGFFDQLLNISRQVRPDRQTLLFSATFPGSLRESANSFISDAIFIRCNSLELAGGEMQSAEGEGNLTSMQSAHPIQKPKEGSANSDVTVPEKNDNEEVKEEREPDLRPSSSLSVSKTVEQVVHICAAHKKPRLLLKYITAAREKEKADKVRQQGPMLIFCNKIKTLKFVKDFLTRQEISCDLLHGQLPQPRREIILKSFQAGKVSILLATDVVARGIHIKRLHYVVNYDFPSTIEQYCHRVGRTGRQGEKGSSYSLLTRNMAPLARGLISLLLACGQPVEPNLAQLADDFEAGAIKSEELEGDEAEGEIQSNDDNNSNESNAESRKGKGKRVSNSTPDKKIKKAKN